MKKTFKQVKVGETFLFDRTGSLLMGAAGPYKKVSERRYIDPRTNAAFNTGSVGAELCLLQSPSEVSDLFI